MTKRREYEAKEWNGVWLRVRCANNMAYPARYKHSYAKCVMLRIKAVIKEGDTNNFWRVY